MWFKSPDSKTCPYDVIVKTKHTGRLIACPFGSPVAIFVPGVHNLDEAKAVFGVCLSRNLLDSTCGFLNLETGRIVHSQDYRSIPLTDSIILRFRACVQKYHQGKLSLNRDLVVKLVSNVENSEDSIDLARENFPTGDPIPDSGITLNPEAEQSLGVASQNGRPSPLDASPPQNGVSPPLNGALLPQNGVSPPLHGASLSQNGVSPPLTSLSQNGVSPPLTSLSQNGVSPPLHGASLPQVVADNGRTLRFRSKRDYVNPTNLRFANLLTSFSIFSLMGVFINLTTSWSPLELEAVRSECLQLITYKVIEAVFRPIGEVIRTLVLVGPKFGPDGVLVKYKSRI
jgi:hypothetical protein